MLLKWLPHCGVYLGIWIAFSFILLINIEGHCSEFLLKYITVVLMADMFCGHSSCLTFDRWWITVIIIVLNTWSHFLYIPIWPHVRNLEPTIKSKQTNRQQPKKKTLIFLVLLLRNSISIYYTLKLNWSIYLGQGLICCILLQEL